MSFEEFTEKFVDDTNVTLREMAEQEGLKPSARATRETLLKLLYSKYEGQEYVPAPVAPKSDKPDYNVCLRSKAARWRGGRKWAPGTTRVSHAEMTDKLRNALESDTGVYEPNRDPKHRPDKGFTIIELV